MPKGVGLGCVAFFGFLLYLSCCGFLTLLRLGTATYLCREGAGKGERHPRDKGWELLRRMEPSGHYWYQTPTHLEVGGRMRRREDQ